MRSQSKIILIVLGILITCFATFYWQDYTLTLPAATILGSMVIVSFVMSILFSDAWRLRTEHLIFNEGQYSIRQKDIVFLPWQESTHDNIGKNPFNEMLAVVFTGGIDYYGISLGGPADSPILVFPAIYLMREGSNFHCLAHLDMLSFRQLPLYVQDHLISLSHAGEFKYRIDVKNTPIYYGNLSKIDCSLTAGNAALERKFKLSNEESTFYEQRQNRLISAQQKDKDFNKKEIIIASPLKRQKDEREDNEQ